MKKYAWENYLQALCLSKDLGSLYESKCLGSLYESKSSSLYESKSRFPYESTLLLTVTSSHQVVS